MHHTSYLLSDHTHNSAAPILVSVSVSGQYQHFLVVSELVKYVIQVPILLLVCSYLLYIKMNFYK